MFYNCFKMKWLKYRCFVLSPHDLIELGYISVCLPLSLFVSLSCDSLDLRAVGVCNKLTACKYHIFYALISCWRMAAITLNGIIWTLLCAKEEEKKCTPMKSPREIVLSKNVRVCVVFLYLFLSVCVWLGRKKKASVLMLCLLPVQWQYQNKR